MLTLKCPKCRQGMPEDDLDAGHCRACGFPIDGPVILDAGPGGRRAVWAGLVLTVLAGAGATGYVASQRLREPVHAQTEVVANEPEPAPAPVPQPSPPPQPADRPNTPAKVPEPEPVKPEPKRPAARPLGVVMKIDPRIAPTRHFDHPDDTAALPDLNTSDRVVLTGRVRTLRIGSVHGKGEIDARGLTAEEVVITGDLNDEAAVVLNAPNGTVTVGGYVGGTAKLTVTAPGGEVVLWASSGRVTGNARVTVIAKRLDLAGKVSGTAKIDVTLSAGGALKFAEVEEGATVTYQRSAATDPPPAVERGVIRGGAKVQPR